MLLVANRCAPALDYKSEGMHREGWLLEQANAPIAMGADSFFDGARFDPVAIAAEATGAKARGEGVRQ